MSTKSQPIEQWCSFDVPVELEDFTAAAVIAFQRYYPETRISVEESLITITNPPSSSHREFMHLLYREKTYQETLELRRILYTRLGK